MNWNNIDTVFFDMDGTLIDLHFEDTFWLQHLPQYYAAHYQFSIEKAHEKLFSHHRSIMGTLNWYCIDYWDNYLGFNAMSLAGELACLLQYRPHVIKLLNALKTVSIETAIITNAHPRNLAFKEQQLNLSQHVDYIVSSHDIGYPKEVMTFWEKLEKLHPFNPERTLFIDDNPAVLQAARNYGIKHTLAISQPNSQRPPAEIPEFKTVHDFRALLPVKKRSLKQHYSEKITNE